MLKKILIAALVIMTLLTAIIPSLAETANVKKYASPVTMYVKTANGGPLNVRSTPAIKDNNLIGQMNYGTKVTVTGTKNFKGSKTVKFDIK